MKKNSECGAVILESTWCILLAMFVFFFMISFGFFLYQKVTVKIVATEVAEEIIHTYKYENVDDCSDISGDTVGSVGKYRYIFRKNKLIRANENKAENLLGGRLTKTTLAKKESDVDVKIEPIVDELGRMHYEVTVEQEYRFLMGDFLKVIGQDETQKFSTTIYVSGTDVLHYINQVKMGKFMLGLLEENSSLVGMIESAISLLHTVFE